MSEEGLVALMIGRPLQLAFPPRHEREAEREVLLAVSGLRGDRFGPIDLEVASGEIVGIAGAEGNGQVQFLRALAGAERATGTATCDGQAARLELADRAAPCRGRAPERRPRVRIALPGPERPGERHDPGAAAAGRSRVPQSPPRAATVDDARTAPEHPGGVDRAAGADALGRESAEGLADATVPARRRQGHPRRGADAGRRRRRALRHLRRVAREGEGRRRDDRQVERPARARRPLRPGGRDVARTDRRRDPRRRARGAPDRRGDRRLAGGRKRAGDRERRRSRREDRQAQRRVAARPDDGPDRRGRRLRDRPAGRLPHELQPPQPAPPDAAAGIRLPRTDVRAPRRRVRRLGGGAHDVLRRRRVLHAVVRHSRAGSCSPAPW